MEQIKVQETITDSPSTKSNPKALNPNAIDPQSNQKITVGFKCAPSAKLQLIDESKDRGISLSEHVEAIVIHYHENCDKQQSNDKTNIEGRKMNEEDLEAIKAALSEVLDEQALLKNAQKQNNNEIPEAPLDLEEMKNEIREQAKTELLEELQRTNLIFPANEDYVKMIKSISEHGNSGKQIDSQFFAELLKDYLFKETRESGLFGNGNVDKDRFIKYTGIELAEFEEKTANLSKIREN